MRMKYASPLYRVGSKRPTPARLKRLPMDFHWKLLERWLQVADLNSHSAFSKVVRSRDQASLVGLEQEYSLQSMEVRAADHGSFLAVREYQAGALLSKLNLSEPSKAAERRSAAKKKFFESEALCRETNRRFLQGEVLPSHIVHSAKAFIGRVLGEVPDVWDLELLRHGPGATYDLKRETDAYYKYAKQPYFVASHLLHSARSIVFRDQRWKRALLGAHPHFAGSDYDILNFAPSELFQECNENRVAFVPKNSRIDRAIAIEPGLSVYFQLGLDSFIRRKLVRVGIDLKDQVWNQTLAQSGAYTGRLATIDLSSASDTVSLGIVALLFPNDWSRFLYRFRSRNGSLDGETFRYEKFSSMGNALTFSIETLTFAALLYAVAQECNQDLSFFRNAAVYGDDIVCPSAIAVRLLCVLREAGFLPNLEKTFISGNVRESCGTEWYHNLSIRPLFWRSNEPNIFTFISFRNECVRRFGFSELSRFLDSFLENVPVGPFSSEPCSSWVFGAMPTPPPCDKHGSYHHRKLIAKARSVERHPNGEFLVLKALQRDNSIERWQLSPLQSVLANGRASMVTRRDAWTIAEKATTAWEWPPVAEV